MGALRPADARALSHVALDHVIVVIDIIVIIVIIFVVGVVYFVDQSMSPKKVGDDIVKATVVIFTGAQTPDFPNGSKKLIR